MTQETNLIGKLECRWDTPSITTVRVKDLLLKSKLLISQGTDHLPCRFEVSTQKDGGLRFGTSVTRNLTRRPVVSISLGSLHGNARLARYEYPRILTPVNSDYTVPPIWNLLVSGAKTRSIEGLRKSNDYVWKGSSPSSLFHPFLLEIIQFRPTKSTTCTLDTPFFTF